MSQTSRLLRHPLARVLLWIMLVMGIAMGVNLAGITLLGTLSGWSLWLDAHATHFLIWRLCLYSLTIYGWLMMRRRLCQNAENRATRQQLVHAEIGAVAAITLLETSVLLT